MKTILITGSGRGIGLALTKIFTEAGCQVLATYRDKKSAEALLKLASENSKIIPLVLDVTKSETYSELKVQLKKIDSLDVLINNSGVIGSEEMSLSQIDIEKVRETIEVNTLGPMQITQLAYPYLKKGSVVAHISSLMGSIQDNSSGGYYDYRMSKTALNMFNKCLSRDLPEVICLTLHPGWVKTEMGGAKAPLHVNDSAAGLFQVITKAQKSQTGHFLDYRGKELHW